MNDPVKPRRARLAPGPPLVPRPRVVARVLAPHPARASRLAELTLGLDGVSAFRRLVRAILPEHEAALLAAGGGGVAWEAARVGAFLDRVEALFPLESYPERYRTLLVGIPFRCDGWWDEDRDLGNLPLGELLLLALVADPFGAGFHESLREYLPTLGIPAALRDECPVGGATPAELAAALSGTRWEAVADYAAWVHARTGIVFLDWSPGDPPTPIPWTREEVAHLTGQARDAERLLRTIGELADWLEAEPAGRFAALVSAVTGDRCVPPPAPQRGAIEERRRNATAAP